MIIDLPSLLLGAFIGALFVLWLDVKGKED